MTQGNLFEKPKKSGRLTQEQRILKVLQERKNQWVNGQWFLREMMLSQYHRAIHNLQHNKERFGYVGTIEASDFKDEHNFKFYRLAVDNA